MLKAKQVLQWCTESWPPSKTLLSVAKEGAAKALVASRSPSPGTRCQAEHCQGACAEGSSSVQTHFWSSRNDSIHDH